MQDEKLQFAGLVTLVGGGDLQPSVLRQALSIAPALVAADGAADRLATMGHFPDAIIGDMDSVTDLEVWRARPTTILQLDEQDTTDFEKCLYSIDALGFICVGFTGGRTDHTLAVLHAMQRHLDRKVVLLSAEDAIALVPDSGLDMAVTPGSRVSFYPLAPIKGLSSHGLKWPVDGLEMQAGHQIGTSNVAVGARISVSFDKRGALVILDQKDIGALIKALD